MYRVFIKTDKEGKITDINSNAFIRDFTDWIEIDRGEEMKHLHAQNNYLGKPVCNEYGISNYIYKEGKIQEVPEDDIRVEVEKVVATIAPSLEERFEKLETALNKLLKLLGKEV